MSELIPTWGEFQILKYLNIHLKKSFLKHKHRGAGYLIQFAFFPELTYIFQNMIQTHLMFYSALALH